jgi:propionate CoA-transferase
LFLPKDKPIGITQKKGQPKFTDDLLEVTFNAREALAQGKKIYYVTTVGLFILTQKGLELTWVMPGVEIQKDILDHAKATIHVSNQVKPVSPELITGQGFKLNWPEQDLSLSSN